MRRPSIRENNELLNAFDYDQHYRNTEARLKLEEPDLWAYVMHALGPEGSAPAMATPRHEITISENVARELYQQGASRAAALDANDQA